MVHFSHFGCSNGFVLDVLVYLSVFDILEIFTGKINFFFDTRKTRGRKRLRLNLGKKD